jgi:hypothetical protein
MRAKPGFQPPKSAFPAETTGVAMALNNFSASILGRSSKNPSVIARAAYNGRCKLEDERTGKVFDYSKKPGLEWEGIFAPNDGRGLPAWVKDRQQLWMEVERKEDASKHRDTAQLARDFKIALPHELSEEQRRWLVTDFGRYLSRKGMIVDAAIHRPDAHSDQRNYHAHMLVTMRSIGPDGFGNKVRAWNRTDELEKWKQRWSDMGARALERAGLATEAERFRHGHETLPKQREHAIKRGDREWAAALDREPTVHEGPQVAAMERRGVKTRKRGKNRVITARNRQRQRAAEGRIPVPAGRILTGITEGIANGITSLVGGALKPEELARDNKRIRREKRDTAAARALERDNELERDREGAAASPRRGGRDQDGGYASCSASLPRWPPAHPTGHPRSSKPRSGYARREAGKRPFRRSLRN